MNQRSSHLLLAACASLCLSSCAPSAEFASRGVVKPPKPDSYTMPVLDEHERYSDKCSILGEINVPDAGLSTNCGFEAVLVKVIDRAKAAGADALKITKITKSKALSECYGITALALAYEGSGSLSDADLLAPPDSQFIEFAGARPCGDDGDLAPIAKTARRINVAPFFAFTVGDSGEAERTRYPVTESRIRAHLVTLLMSAGYEINALTNDSKDHAAYSEYLFDVVQNTEKGKGSPLEWGVPLKAIVMDSTSFVYIPLGIERESQRHVEARFYALIANWRGEIVFSRSFEYNPMNWSKDFKAFAEDVEGKLPLAGK